MGHRSNFFLGTSSSYVGPIAGDWAGHPRVAHEEQDSYEGGVAKLQQLQWRRASSGQAVRARRFGLGFLAWTVCLSKLDLSYANHRVRLGVVGRGF